MFRVDAREVHRLARDLGDVEETVLPKIRRSVSRGANNIKRGMRADAKSSGSYKHFHRSITYDLHDDGLHAEIGPDKDLVQGALGNILYFGTSNNAPELDINGPLKREDRRFERAVADIAEDVL